MIFSRSSAEDDRAQLAGLLLSYCREGVIESLRDDFSQPGDIKTLDDYAECCRSVQLRLLQKFRHFIFVSGSSDKFCLKILLHVFMYLLQVASENFESIISQSKHLCMCLFSAFYWCHA